MKVEPISHAAGARIIDIDLSQEMDATTFSKVHQAWLDHHVLVFPGQELSEEDLVPLIGRDALIGVVEVKAP